MNTGVFSFFSDIRWQDIMDIAVNSYVLFRLYVLLRGTNAFRALIGIGLLLFFERVAVVTGLIVTSWVSQGITAVTALIIIVVFSNEIRAVFQTQNLKAILWGIPKKKIQTPIELIVESVFEMANRHCGALIVLQGTDRLNDVIQNGLTWNGVLSKEMILSIFFKDNPVHDGAAIIQGDRITEVGVILPLSQRRDLPSHYGTRHRAAVGLAELKDAMVIVVSEERGKVSVARGHHIEIVNRRVDLEQILKEYVGIDEKQTETLKKEKFKLSAALIISIALVIGIWFTTTRGMDTLITLEVPVEYMNLAPSMEILDTSVDSVRLHLNGSVVLMKSIRPEQVRIRVNMNKAVVGKNKFTLSQENISLPPGVSLRKISPPILEVTLDIPVKKELPIQATFSGKLNDNLILSELTIEPKTISLIAGSLTMDSVSTIYTEKIPLERIEKSGRMSVKLAIDPAYLKTASNVSNKVTVFYVVKERK